MKNEIVRLEVRSKLTPIANGYERVEVEYYAGGTDCVVSAYYEDKRLQDNYH